jgi:hypothetical protein
VSIVNEAPELLQNLFSWIEYLYYMDWDGDTLLFRLYKLRLDMDLSYFMVHGIENEVLILPITIILRGLKLDKCQISELY